MIRSRFAPLLLATLALAGCGKSDDTPKAGSPVAAVPAPAGTTWAQQAVVTEEGVRMGNPNAAIRVIEYGSYTCPHCRDFQMQSHEAIERDYVNPGKVSFEYRNYIRHPLDLSAALIAGCGAPETQFAMIGALFANQEAMINQFSAQSPADQEAIGTLAPNQRFVRLAELAGLIDFAKQRGLPEERARTCLADVGKAQKLAAGNEALVKKYPAFSGTPSFILNDTLLDDTASWEKLQPHLRNAGA